MSVGYRLQRWVWLVLGLLAPALPLQLYLGGSWSYVLHSYSLGMFFGLIAYTYFTECLVLAARLPYFDRLFGHDRVLVFHGRLAAAALTAAFAHAILKYLYYGAGTVQVTLGSVALAMFAAVGAVTVLFMIDTGLQSLKVFGAMKKYFVTRIGFDYSRLKLYHNVTALAVLLMTMHVLMASPTAENYTRIIIVVSMGLAGIAFHFFHKVARPILLYRQPFVAKDIRQISSDVVRLSTSRPGGALLKYRAGQFAYFRILSRACGIEEHPFTIASAPGAQTLDIVVKELGNYTDSLKDLENGARILCDGPYGNFTPVRDEHPYLFVAGGIGITPFLSILAEWRERGMNKPVTLIWSVRHQADLIDEGMFARMASDIPAFTFVPVITRPLEGEGRHIDRQMIEKYLPAGASVYICGPRSLRDSVSRTLRDLGVCRVRIHYEGFFS